MRTGINGLSWTNGMNLFHSFCESLYNRTVREAELRGIFVFSVFIFFCLAQFTLFVYKSLIIVVENFQKYHWIQQETTQPVVVTRRRNKFLWTSEAKNRPFSIISSWIRFIYCIKDIKLNKMSYVTYSTLFAKHDKLHYIVIESIDLERDLT